MWIFLYGGTERVPGWEMRGNWACGESQVSDYGNQHQGAVLFVPVVFHSLSHLFLHKVHLHSSPTPNTHLTVFDWLYSLLVHVLNGHSKYNYFMIQMSGIWVTWKSFILRNRLMLLLYNDYGVVLITMLIVNNILPSHKV